MNVELIYFPCGSADLSRRRTERALFSATLSNQVWDRRVETVKSKLSAVEMYLLQNFEDHFFYFFFYFLFTGLLKLSNIVVTSNIAQQPAQPLSKQVTHHFNQCIH